MRLRILPDPDYLPALDKRYALEHPALDLGPEGHPPRILLLYGSLRTISYSRLAVEEAARLLRFFGAETRIFDPIYPFPIRSGATTIRRSASCGSCRCGRKGRYGAVLNGTARSPA